MQCPLQKQSVRQSDFHHLVKINESKQENIANTKISRITCTIFNSNLPAPCIILYKFLPNTMEFFHKNLNSVLILNGLYLLQKLVINYYWASCTQPSHLYDIGVAKQGIQLQNFCKNLQIKQIKQYYLLFFLTTMWIFMKL